MSAPLADLGTRLQALWSSPETYQRGTHWIRQVWLRSSRSLDRPLRSDALRAFRALPGVLVPAGDWDQHRGEVVEELQWNVSRTEAVARATGAVDSAELTWLFGVLRWIRSMDRAMSSHTPHAQASVSRGLGSTALLPRAEVDAERVLLGGIDAVLDEAASEQFHVARRQRLLLAARRILIDAESGAAGGVAWSERRALITFELAQLREVASAGIDARVDLRYQLRQHLDRDERPLADRVSAALMYLQPHAAASPQRAALAEGAGRAIWPTGANASIPDDVSVAVERGYRRAHERLAAALETAIGADALELRRRRTDLESGSALDVLQSVLGAEGVFDVGGGLEREEFDAQAPTTRHVSFPTEAFDLEPATGPEDVPTSIIEDPRLLLYHLSSRRLLQRRYIRSHSRAERRSGVRATVRFYLLDGSSSMHGVRARVRDAILISELSSLISRLQSGGRLRSLLFYRYFTTEAEPTRRVTTTADALDAIEEILCAVRSGGTDIQRALLDSLELIEQQRDDDVDLMRAQIVLVSDGQSTIDPELLIAAQERLDIPVRVSVISLGADNQVLRDFAAHQRHQGLRVLYHHVPDDELAPDVEGTRIWRSQATDDPHRDLPGDVPHRSSPPRDPREFILALGEVSSELHDLDEGTRAKLEYANRELRSLRAHFDRFFPPRASARVVASEDERLAVLDALAIVLEVVTLTRTDPDQAKVDAIAVLERLLRDRGISPTRYLEIVDSQDDTLGHAMSDIRESCSAGA